MERAQAPLLASAPVPWQRGAAPCRASWEEARRRRQAARGRRRLSLPGRSSPCPNVDVRQLERLSPPVCSSAAPPASVHQAGGLAMPSFLDDPSGYLAQQTQLLNDTMQEGLSPVPPPPQQPTSTAHPQIGLARTGAVTGRVTAASDGSEVPVSEAAVEEPSPAPAPVPTPPPAATSTPVSLPAAVTLAAPVEAQATTVAMETAPSAPISVPSAPISAPTLAPAASTAVLSGSAPSSIPLPLQLPVSVCIPVSSFSMTPVSVSMSVALPLVQGAVTSVQHPSAARSAPGRVAASRAAAPPPVRTSVTATPTTVMATPRAPSATRPSPACQPRRATPPTLAPAPPPQQYQVLGQPELPLVQSLPAGQIILPSGQVILTQPIQPMLQYVNAFPMQSPVLLPGGGLLQTVEEPRPVAPPPPPPTSGRRRRRKPQERSATVASMLRGAAPPAAAAPGVMNGLPTFVVGAAGKPLVLSSGQPGVNFLQPLLLPGAGGQVFIQNMSMGAPLLSAGSVFPVSAAPQVAGGQLLQVVSVLGDAAAPAAPAAAAAPLVAAPPAVVQTPADSSTPDGAGGWPGRVSPPQEAGLVSSTVEPADSDTEPEETGRAALKRKRPHPDEPAQTPGFAVGDLVWGSNQGLDSWPGQVIQRTDVQPCPAGHVWVRWFGDHTMSLQTVASLRKFHTHNTAKHKKSHALNGSFEEALQEALTAVNRQRN
ncbi:hypothetical protein FJT64_013751 [Amphibalanus amphitrite]|uniref:PWWP domain-containing protein n=1 Tax=Amphibalanus amphitrite TaxID=1232801 RepID=A0A6A4UVP6_AMPAM|nr:hypothetical protein FJT64_013751 [Amphibalanus amphitrite]